MSLCIHVKSDGQRCGSFAKRGSKFCANHPGRRSRKVSTAESHRRAKLYCQRHTAAAMRRLGAAFKALSESTAKTDKQVVNLSRILEIIKEQTK